jgi:pimeloyl-ACP methyl ester carboxylesterase
MKQFVRSPHHKVRGYFMRSAKIFLALIISLFLLVLLTFFYQNIMQGLDHRTYQPEGRMIDVGGYRLHLYCTGQGTPAIILESGLGGPAMQWWLVQQELSQTNQVCSYDRAGLGWSDFGPLPRTTQQMVSELHLLLQNAGIAGPYVLVGHSLGGFTVRLYAAQFPGETAGIVLVAAGSENDDAEMPPEYQKIDQANLQTDHLLSILARFGVTRIAGNLGLLSSFTGLLSKFPEKQRSEMISLTFDRASYWSTAYQELLSIDQDKSEVAASGSLGNLPLVVLSGSPDVSRLPASFPVMQIKNTFETLQNELANLSTNSIHIVCETCDHYIPMTDPEEVVYAVRKELVKVENKP